MWGGLSMREAKGWGGEGGERKKERVGVAQKKKEIRKRKQCQNHQPNIMILNDNII